MKKTIVYGALIALIGTAHAETSPPAATPTAAPQAAAADKTPSAQPQAPAVIDCNYKIPAETKKIDTALITTWAEKATMQSFNFNADSVDNQIKNLQACFTDPGWEGFNSALQKSGNIEAIKSQKLNVTSKIDGQTQVTETKENQWDVTLPLQVIYQNDKEKLTQLLQINLSVGRKASGDLGIIKIIASTRKEAAKADPSAAKEPQAATASAQATQTPPSADTKNATAPK